jgi:hypothetical protein
MNVTGYGPVLKRIWVAPGYRSVSLELLLTGERELRRVHLTAAEAVELRDQLDEAIRFASRDGRKPIDFGALAGEKMVLGKRGAA